MKTTDFDYDLPPELIAQHPLQQRDASRLMVLDRASGAIEHRQFKEIIHYLAPTDVLVANDSRVIPARLYARKEDTGGRVELLLLEQIEPQRWRALVGGRRLREGVIIRLEEPDGSASAIVGAISEVLEGAQRVVAFNQPIEHHLARLGHTPLPPYIREHLDDPERYQTIYARPPGSAAAPTAGLHFTPELLIDLRKNGVLFETCTLHVGLDTFKPVESEDVASHTIHSEWARLTPEAARRINEAKLAGHRVVAVGTTAVRVLETGAHRSAGNHGSLQEVSQQPPPAFCPWKPVAAFEGPTDLYIYPGYSFRVVDSLITNFHLPQSSLLMLVSAFAGRERILNAYQEAIRRRYRFYSFGDAMLIL